jgi:hypothetical protein
MRDVVKIPIERETLDETDGGFLTGWTRFSGLFWGTDWEEMHGDQVRVRIFSDRIANW